MATQNITVNYPDGQQTRILTALKGSAKTELVPAPTNAQALAWFEGRVRELLRDIVHNYEQQQAANAIMLASALAAEEARLANVVTPVTVT